MNERYFIRVHYPKTTNKKENIEYAYRFPLHVSGTNSCKWSTDKLDEKRCYFTELGSCMQYIRKRFEKSFNRDYTYSVYKQTEDNSEIVGSYNYNKISNS